MEQQAKAFEIRDAFWELKQTYTSNWVDRWVIPNPFVVPLSRELAQYGVTLADFSFSSEPKNLADASLTISIPSISSAVVLGLDQVLYLAKEPTWQMAPNLVEIFQLISSAVERVAGCVPASQSSSLAFHLLSGELDLGAATQRWVHPDRIGQWDFCGLSLHRQDTSLILDKSLRHSAAAFFKLQRTFAGDVGFADIALQLMKDELAALNLLGISEVP